MAFCDTFVAWLSSERTNRLPILYSFRLQDASEYARLEEAFLSYLATPRETSLSNCRLNHPEEADALYVGTSRTSLRKRISEHLGRTGSRATAALRLRDWAAGSTATVNFTAWVFQPELTPIELEALEQQLWDELHPLLGKRSGR
ncbi:MAG TPA: hypothetical protein VEW26_16150 [Allosphingosinicella sp.]|nr:hypothetical protein [Allosphingosinicella sp.]